VCLFVYDFVCEQDYGNTDIGDQFNPSSVIAGAR